MSLADNEVSGGDLSRWRIFFYGLRQSEIGEEPHVGGKLADTKWLKVILEWVHSQLEGCDCVDGCSMCCAGLGTLSLQEWTAKSDRFGTKFEENDVVTRRGAYGLACLLLGKAPDWRAFCEGSGGRTGTSGPTLTDAELESMVAEVIGTATREYRDGTWTRLFGDRMPLPPTRVAPAGWLPDDYTGGLAGFYVSGENLVRIRKGMDPVATREVILHEYVHNWQYEAPSGFDLEEHTKSAESLQFFDGKLVIEGHARWSEAQFRFDSGLSPVHTPEDDARWDEYKAGYFLVEGIAKAVGEHGLFAWLADGADSKDETVRSRVRALSWPFSLVDAMKTIRPGGDKGPNLIEICRGRKFTDWDVEEAAAAVASKTNETPTTADTSRNT
jgi:hypothetical protein